MILRDDCEFVKFVGRVFEFDVNRDIAVVLVDSEEGVVVAAAEAIGQPAVVTSVKVICVDMRYSEANRRAV